MKIGIIGGGATGLLMAAYLGVSHEVTVFVRRLEQQEDLMCHGVRLNSEESATRVKSEQLNNIKADQDVIFVCVKQPDIPEVIATLSRLQMTAPLVFLQNGLGHLRQLTMIKGASLTGVVNHGAIRKNNVTVHHTGQGNIKIAYEEEKQFEITLVTSLSNPDFPIYASGRKDEVLKEKLIVNAVINPLTALFNVKNGEVISNPYINNMARQLCLEACAILHMDADTQWALIQNIVRKTAGNTSSMLMDVMRARPTEIDAITGYLIEQTGSGQSNELNRFVHHAIHALQIEKGGKA
ncbi:2-dehydropantoate 2-reductase [Thalassobacillus sp. CUG 92003]|uniref:2-dehydropantoate 2-reductase n=1 Tax=Thalassobacillus sp. CUG 92003 TaxID=2736641 RepID=UPI0015E71785|nr:2-dehydropantoate 2-reductase [Thalassobacillus sp. CUG 92003]